LVMTLSDGRQIAGEDLRHRINEARAVTQSLQSLSRRVGSQMVSEQALLAGVFQPDLLDDPATAQTAAETLAARLNALSPELERGWAGEYVRGENGSAHVKVSRSLRKLTETYEFDALLLHSMEARRLASQADALREIYDQPAILTAKEKELQIDGPVSLWDEVMQVGRKGLTINRYKGLGEMNPEQLWETTLDPEARSLLQVKVSGLEEAEEVFSTLMGDLVEPRRDFIQTNALEVENLDI